MPAALSWSSRYWTVSANWVKDEDFFAGVGVDENLPQRGEFGVLGGIPVAEPFEDSAQGVGVGEQVLVQGVCEEMRAEPTEAAAVARCEILVDLGGALAEINFGAQEGGCGRLGRGLLLFLVERYY